jgi:hypothetical protein
MDGTQWNFFDLQYPQFTTESRNIRFALSTDGMNPFSENRTMHSTWPVILTMFNILTWLCHKRKYLMLSILIQGSNQDGIDIDVFLEPLMEDMVKLWNEGVSRKIKDKLKSCNDPVQFCLRPELHPKLRPNGKHCLAQASYSLIVEEKKHSISACVGFEYPQVSHRTSANLSK